MTAPHEPLVVDEVELARRAETRCSCGCWRPVSAARDLSYMDGKWPIPCPVVLGHEGAGTIEAVGEGVDPGRVGERVVLTFAPSCGRCRFCLEGRVNLCAEAAACMDAGVLRDGTHAADVARRARRYHLAFVSSFATHAVCPANAAIPVRRTLDPSSSRACWDAASRPACCRSRGARTCARASRSRSSPAAASGSRQCRERGSFSLTPSSRSIRCPPSARSRSRWARRTRSTLRSETRREQIRALVPGGVDHAFEAIGNPEVAAQAFASVRDGGTTTLIGQPADGRARVLPGLRRDAVRAHDPGLQPRRREPGAARAAAGAFGGRWAPRPRHAGDAPLPARARSTKPSRSRPRERPAGSSSACLDPHCGPPYSRDRTSYSTAGGPSAGEFPQAREAP